MQIYSAKNYYKIQMQIVTIIRSKITERVSTYI